MKRFKQFLKNVVKTVSGYELQGCGRGGYFGIGKDNVEMQCVYPGSLILTEKEHHEPKQTWGIYGYLRQQRLKTILETYQINVVIDVGANKGQFAKGLRATGYKGRIISFEPVSSTFEALKTAAQSDTNWEVYNLALGRQNGEQKIYVADDSVFTSFLESSEVCEQQFGKGAVGSREETVMIRRLDEVLHETIDNLEQAKIYLKMDTQGYDLEVFAGLGSMDNMISALQSEISVVPLYEGMPHLTESISVFEKAGFELAGMYPVVMEDATLRIIEFDCFMVNPKIKLP